MTATSVKVKRGRPAVASSIKAWRVEYLGPEGRTGPFGGTVARGTRPVCGGRGGHPPAPGCLCGDVFALDDVRNTVNLLKSCEHAQQWRATHQRQLPAAKVEEDRHTRLAVIEGELHGAVSPPLLAGGGRLVPVSSNGYAGIGAVAAAALGSGEIIALAVQGDPPGTWRGGSFTPTRVVMQLWPGDDLDLYADLLPAKRVTIERAGPDRLLSAIVRRYARSGRTDPRRWTA